MTHRELLALVFVATLAAAGLAAQAPPQSPPPPPPAPAATGAKSDVPPMLSEIDRLKIQNALQAIELWTLKIQAAAAELQKARTEAEKLVGAVAVPGWQLNDRLEYVRATKDGKQ